MTKYAISGIRQKWLAVLIACSFFVLFLDPFGMATGLYDSNPYRAITARLQHADGEKILFLASYDDFYNIPINDWLRSQIGEGFVERGYDEVLSAASLGEKVFNQYLRRNKVKYVVTPITTSQRGRIFYKFGDRGSVNIQLRLPYFRELEQSGGDYPLGLYQVETVGEEETSSDSTNYSIAWTGVRESFHKETRRVSNNKFLTELTFESFYEDGEGVSWVFEGERVAFVLKSVVPSTRVFTIELVLQAAYGPNAPTQMVRVKTNSEKQVATLIAGSPVTVKIMARMDEVVEIMNLLSCKSPAVFDPSGGDGRKFCYGVTDLRVRFDD